MKLSPQIKRRLRWQNTLTVIFLLCLVGILAWLSNQSFFFYDLTSSKKNHPSEETETLLQQISEDIEIRAFISPDNKTKIREIESLVARYQRLKENISLEVIDPVRAPKLIREYNILGEGELLITIGELIEHIPVADEESITNALGHIIRQDSGWILFLEGHNERTPFKDTDFDYNAWHNQLQKHRVNVRNYNLADTAQIPINTRLLIISDPQKQFLQGEVNILQDYIANGGNLLWLLEPGELKGLDPLAEALGIEVIPGTVVDPNTQVVGINDPRFTLITQYPESDITQNIESVSIYPTATALEFFGTEEWDANAFLETLPRTWVTEMNINEITLDSPPSVNGPLAIAFALQRAAPMQLFVDEETDTEEETEDQRDSREQRVVVVGDSDFASDAYLGEGANMEIASGIINWLINSENQIEISPKHRVDRSLQLDKTEQVIIGFGFLIAIPASLLLIGFIIWRKRRKA